MLSMKGTSRLARLLGQKSPAPADDVPTPTAESGTGRADVVDAVTASWDGPFDRIALVGHEPDLELVRALESLPGASEVVVTDPDLGPDRLRFELASRGRYDLVVETPGAADPTERARRARSLLPHLKRGGVLCLLDAVGGDQSDALVVALEDLLLSGLRAGAGRRPVRTQHQFLAADPALAGVGVRGTHLVLVNGGALAFVKVREEDAADYLSRRGPNAGRVLETRAAAHLDAPAPIRESANTDAPRWKTSFDAPPLQLREYRNATSWRGQVVTQGNLLLADSFRHLARPRINNLHVENVTRDFGRVLQRAKPRALEGVYFHLDSEVRGHFGHATTEQISRLWAWRAVKEQYPEARALMQTHKRRKTVAEWEYRLYEAAGIDRSDLVLVDGPVRVDLLLAATPALSQPQYIHPAIRDVYREIGDNLAATAPERDYPERIFCSRRHNLRSCHNTPEVEEFFAARGFEIVYPEDYPLGEQVGMFRAARDIAGFAGSAMFTTSFVLEPRRVFLVCSESYTAQNEALIAAVNGHRLHLAWCEPDKRKGTDSPRREAVHASFTFDPAREGAFLREHLD